MDSNKDINTTVTKTTPETLFNRFLQRKTKSPTDKQLQRWEDEGGCVPITENDPEFYEDKPLSQRVGAYLSRAWKSLNSNFNPLEKKNIQ